MIAQFFVVFKDYLIEVLPFLAVGFFLSGFGAGLLLFCNSIKIDDKIIIEIWRPEGG